MRNKLIVGLLVVVVIIAAGVVWSIRTKNNAPASPIAAIPQAQPVSQALIASSTKQTGKGSTFHFYSPLHDPPPIATRKQLWQWELELRTTLINEIKPDLGGPPLASAYAKEAAKANHGDMQAATTLFDGLAYCARETRGSLDNEQELNRTIEHMRETQTDRDGLHTANLAADIAHVQQQYHYCAGLTAAENIYNMGHWARLAAQGGNPATLVWSVGYYDMKRGAGSFARPKDMSITAWKASIHKARERDQIVINRAAQAGVPTAWMYMSMGYRLGSMGYPINPTREYASLYTEYMLTKSPFLAYQIWQQSQRLNPLQVQEGESLAHRYYQRIQSE